MAEVLCATVLPPDAEPCDLSRSDPPRAMIAACSGAAESQRSSSRSAAIEVIPGAIFAPGQA